jgi:excisionase family DNA binding protein
MLKKPTDDKLLKAMDVASFLGFSSGTIYRYARAGRLSGIKIGGQWRFEWEHVQDFLGNCGQETEAWMEAREAATANHPLQPTPATPA